MKKAKKKASPRQRATDYAQMNFDKALRLPASTIFKAWMAGYRNAHRDENKKEAKRA